MKRLLVMMALMTVWAATMWADSPLTSTDFSQAYADIPMVASAGDVEPWDCYTEDFMQFLADKKNPIDVRLAVINRLVWTSEGLDGANPFLEFLMAKYKAKTPEKLVKKLEAKTLCVYAYQKAMSNYFEVDEACELAHLAVKKDKEHCLSVALIAALIDAQKYLHSGDWGQVYTVVANVVHDGSLKLDMRQEALDIIMEYIGEYKKYVK